MKRSTLIILSFIALTITLTVINIILSKKYTKKVHNIDLYEGFVIKTEEKSDKIEVFFKTKFSGNTTFYSPTISGNNKGTWTYNKCQLFNPTKVNSLPVRFKDLNYKIIYGKITECFTGKPNYSVPSYLQKTMYFIDKALFIESAVNIRYQNDTIIIEKAQSRWNNSYTLLFENTKFVVSSYRTRNGFFSYPTGIYSFNLPAFSEIKQNDIAAINQNMKSVSIVKPNGDIIETYHSITLKNFSDNYLIANWYVNVYNLEQFKSFRYNRWNLPPIMPE